MNANEVELEIATAKFVFGLLSSRDLVQIADAALNRGIYSDAMCTLAFTEDPRMDEVNPIFEKALRELAIPLPSREDAAWRLLRHHIGSIASRTVRPREGLSRIVNEVYFPACLYEQSCNYTGDSHGIEHLYGTYWAYDDLEERTTEVSFEGKYGTKAIEALDADVVRLAKDWLTKYPIC